MTRHLFSESRELKEILNGYEDQPDDVILHARSIPAGVVRDALSARELKAQRDALARLIMGLEVYGKEQEHMKDHLQTEAQQILGPDWKDPLEELYKLIVAYETEIIAPVLIMKSKAKEIMGEG